MSGRAIFFVLGLGGLFGDSPDCSSSTTVIGSALHPRCLFGSSANRISALSMRGSSRPCSLAKDIGVDDRQRSVAPALPGSEGFRDWRPEPPPEDLVEPIPE